MYDIIGDIHGHADELEALLGLLGYSKRNNTYWHPERKILFLGDYIDRGPKISRTLAVVRSMVENDQAIALMGNHEYNALCFHFQSPAGGHLRKHLIKNITQHYNTLHQFEHNQKDYEDYLEWFKTLPLFFETDGFRAVHACWDEKNIKLLQQKLVNNRLTDELIYESVQKGTDFHNAVDQTLKGKEIAMPQGHSFTDKYGQERTEIRIKWWENPEKLTYRSVSVEPLESLPDQPVNLSEFDSRDYYHGGNKKVFFGHYWLKGQPAPFKPNVCCLDYSVADKGKLVAYQLDDNHHIDSNKFVYV